MVTLMVATSFSLEDRDLTKILTMRSYHREKKKPGATEMDLPRKCWRRQEARMMVQLHNQDSQAARRPWPLGSLANISMIRNQQYLKDWAPVFLIAIYPNQIRRLDFILKKELLMLEIQDMPRPSTAVSWEVSQLDSTCCMKEKYLPITPRKFSRLHLIRIISAKTLLANSIQLIIRIHRMYLPKQWEIIQARSSHIQMRSSMMTVMKIKYSIRWEQRAQDYS